MYISIFLSLFLFDAWFLMTTFIFIWSIFLAICIKRENFLGSFWFLDQRTIFLLSIFGVVYFLIHKIFFNFSHYVEKFTFYFLFGCLFFSLFLCFLSCSLFLFLVFIEFCVIFMIIILFNYSKDSDKISSTLFMFFTNILGSIPFIIFRSRQFSFSGENSLVSISQDYRFLIFLFFSLILFSKLPLVFLHFWLTKAHVRASGRGSIILARLLLKIGGVGFSKWGFIFNWIFNNYLYLFILNFRIFFSLFILFIINRFFDVKYLVACSSIIHISLIRPFLLYNSFGSFYSRSLMIVGHGLISCLIFYLVTFLYELRYNRSSICNKSLESLFPVFSFFFIFSFLLNLGFPPFVRFITEIYFASLIYQRGVFPSIIFFLILFLRGKFFINLCLSSMYYKNSFFHFRLPMSFTHIIIISSFFLYFFFFLFLQ